MQVSDTIPYPSGYPANILPSPVKAYWELAPTYPHQCMNSGAIVFSASVINIFTDFLVTVLPMPLIWNLKLPARQRIAVISIFGLGIVVNVAGSVRTVYVWKSMIASYDSTWLGWPILLAASVEINMGLVSPRHDLVGCHCSNHTRFAHPHPLCVLWWHSSCRGCFRAPATITLPTTTKAIPKNSGLQTADRSLPGGNPACTATRCSTVWRSCGR